MVRPVSVLVAPRRAASEQIYPISVMGIVNTGNILYICSMNKPSRYPIKKPILHISEETDERIRAFRHEMQFGSEADALRALIEFGLEEYRRWKDETAVETRFTSEYNAQVTEALIIGKLTRDGFEAWRKKNSNEWYSRLEKEHLG